MEKVTEKKVFKNIGRGFEIFDLDNMQKVKVTQSEVNKLFLQQLEKESDSTFDGLSLEDMERVENLFFNIRLNEIKRCMKDNAWRATLDYQGEDYVNQAKDSLISSVKQYRMMFPDQTHNIITLEKENKEVIVDKEYNVEIISTS